MTSTTRLRTYDGEVKPATPSLAGVVLYIMCATGGILIALVALPGLRESDPVAVYAGTAVAACIGVGAKVLIDRRGPWSAANAYLIIFALFHFGLTALVGAGVKNPQTTSPWNVRWLYTPAALEASVLAVVGVLSYSIASLLVGARRAVPRSRAGQRRNGDDPRFSRRIEMVGAGMLWGAVLAWGRVVVGAAGLGGLTGSYGAYLQSTATAGSTMAWVWFSLGLGVVIVLTSEPSRLRRLSLIPLALFAPVALGLGLRGEIMFPLVTAGVLFHWQGRPLSSVRTALLLIVGLFSVALIRNLRDVGVAGASSEVLQGSAWDGLEELGGTLFPVAAVVSWHQEGDPFINGASYWAPFERAAARLLPGVSRLPAEDDERLMHVLVSKRIGPIGFSPVAEAYRNFGAAGVLGVMGLIGALLAGLDNMRPSRGNQVLGSIVFIPMLINVRNSFVHVPAQIALGVTVYALVRVVPSVRRSAMRRDNQPDSFLEHSAQR